MLQRLEQRGGRAAPPAQAPGDRLDGGVARALVGEASHRGQHRVQRPALRPARGRQQLADQPRVGELPGRPEQAPEQRVRARVLARLPVLGRAPHRVGVVLVHDRLVVAADRQDRAGRGAPRGRVGQVGEQTIDHGLAPVAARGLQQGRLLGRARRVLVDAVQQRSRRAAVAEPRQRRDRAALILGLVARQQLQQRGEGRAVAHAGQLLGRAEADGPVAAPQRAAQRLGRGRLGDVAGQASDGGVAQRGRAGLRGPGERREGVAAALEELERLLLQPVAALQHDVEQHLIAALAAAGLAVAGEVTQPDTFGGSTRGLTPSFR